jgi:hypothetical protein
MITMKIRCRRASPQTHDNLKDSVRRLKRSSLTLSRESKAAVTLAYKETCLKVAQLSALVALAFGCTACIVALSLPSFDDCLQWVN